MKRHRKNQRKYSSTPEKPDLEIVSSSTSESDQTTVPGTTQELEFDREGTSDETMEETAYSSAPVYWPHRDELAQRLVPADLIYKYDEYRSDGSTMSAAFTLCIGAFFGVIVNWATS